MPDGFYLIFPPPLITFHFVLFIWIWWSSVRSRWVFFCLVFSHQPILKPAEWNKPVKALKKEMLSPVALVASGSIITEALSLTFEVVSTQTIITEIMKPLHRCCKDSVLTWTSDSSTHLSGPESLCGNITLCCSRLQRNGVRWLNKTVFEWFPKPRRICARCEPGATQIVDSVTAVWSILARMIDVHTCRPTLSPYN